MESKQSKKIQAAHSDTGHRKRLKERLIKSPIRTLPDYELLEMLLFSIHPRRDVKPIAKEMLSHFSSLPELIMASEEKIEELGHGSSIWLFKLLKDLFSRLHIPVNHKIHIINNWSAVVNYCKVTMAFKDFEVFKVLFLSKRNILITDEDVNQGTLDKVAIYPREIIKRALHHKAHGIVLVHNHPSGDPSPSNADIEITRKMQQSLKAVDIKLQDHVIICQDDFFSFRNSNLL